MEATDINFKLLNKKITKKHILGFPSFDKIFQVETYSSGRTIEVVLSQEHRPLTYFNNNLNEEKKTIHRMTQNYMLLYKLSKNGDIT